MGRLTNTYNCMKNKIRIKTKNGREIVFNFNAKEICSIDATREAIFLWDDGDFTTGWTDGLADGDHFKIFTAPGQDSVYYAMEADRLIAWAYADEQKGGEL